MKDMIDVAGLIRTDGAREALWRRPVSSPRYVEALRASGLNILAVTNVPEFASLPTTVNLEFGATANPWKLDRTPAGSSGGSAVAAGYVPLAHATDGSGSIRLPASYCGVFGFKPSRGRTLPGEADGRHDLLKHHQGLSRSVRDGANLLAVCEDRREGAPYRPIGRVRSPERRRLRIEVLSEWLQGERPDAAQGAALADASRLCAELGHRVEAISRLPINGAIFWRSLESIFLARMPALISAVEAATGKSFDETRLLSPFTMSFALRARREVPDAVEKAMRQFDLFARDMQTILTNHDVLLSPVQPVVQPAIDVYDPNGSFEREAESIRAFMTFTALAIVIGAPAMSVPLHWTDEGLTLGAHFMARPGQDRMLPELAFELEATRPWQDRWPPHSIQALVGGIP